MPEKDKGPSPPLTPSPELSADIAISGKFFLHKHICTYINVYETKKPEMDETPPPATAKNASFSV